MSTNCTLIVQNIKIWHKAKCTILFHKHFSRSETAKACFWSIFDFMPRVHLWYLRCFAMLYILHLELRSGAGSSRLWRRQSEVVCMCPYFASVLGICIIHLYYLSILSIIYPYLADMRHVSVFISLHSIYLYFWSVFFLCIKYLYFVPVLKVSGPAVACIWIINCKHVSALSILYVKLFENK